MEGWILVGCGRLHPAVPIRAPAKEIEKGGQAAVKQARISVVKSVDAPPETQVTFRCGKAYDRSVLPSVSAAADPTRLPRSPRRRSAIGPRARLPDEAEREQLQTVGAQQRSANATMNDTATPATMVSRRSRLHETYED